MASTGNWAFPMAWTNPHRVRWSGLARRDRRGSQNGAGGRNWTELTQAYSEAQAEWGAIDRDLLKWAVPTIGTALVTGIFSPVIAASGLAVAGLGEIIQEEMKRREFRKKVPMSVFIDLEKG